jgi:hypothetical protein
VADIIKVLNRIDYDEDNNDLNGEKFSNSNKLCYSSAECNARSKNPLT